VQSGQIDRRVIKAVMETVSTSEMSVSFDQNALRNIPEDIRRSCRRKNLKYQQEIYGNNRSVLK
jgi:hypothetical protein